MARRTGLIFVLRAVGGSISVIAVLVLVFSVALGVADWALPRRAKLVSLLLLDVLLAVNAIGAWRRFGMVMNSYLKAPEDDALRARAQEVLPAALGASFAVALGLDAILGGPVRPPYSTTGLVLAVTLLSAPSLLFNWRYRPRRSKRR